MKAVLIVAAFLATVIVMLCIVAVLCTWFVRKYRIDDTDKIRQSDEKTYTELSNKFRECIKSGDNEKALELHQKLIKMDRAIPRRSTPGGNYSFNK